MKTKGERLGWLKAKSKEYYAYQQSLRDRFNLATKGKKVSINFQKLTKEELESGRRTRYNYLIP